MKIKLSREEADLVVKALDFWGISSPNKEVCNLCTDLVTKVHKAYVKEIAENDLGILGLPD